MKESYSFIGKTESSSLRTEMKQLPKIQNNNVAVTLSLRNAYIPEENYFMRQLIGISWISSTQVDLSKSNRKENKNEIKNEERMGG